jgi:hypothetical protein
MDHVVLNFEKHFRASSILKPNQRDKIALMHSLKCKIVSGIITLSPSRLICRAHPDVYKPLDALDDDELDDASEEALETATKKGDEKLKNDGSKSADKDKEDKKSDDKKEEGKKSEDKKQNDSKPEHKKPKAIKEDAHNNGSDKKPKQGDERKNESKVARSG